MSTPPSPPIINSTGQNTSTVVGKFKATKFRFGAMLAGTDYNPNQFKEYNPCEKLQRTECYLTTTRVQCMELPPSIGQGPPRQNDLRWEGEFSYLGASDPQAIFEDGQVITWQDDRDRALVINSNADGSIITRSTNWIDSGRTRKLEFKTKKYLGSGMIEVEEAMMYNDQIRDKELLWSKGRRAFRTQMIRTYFNEIFHCDEIVLNFLNKNQNQPGCKFLAKNFEIGFYLSRNYNIQTLQRFNPCDGMCGGSNKCTCRLIDDYLTCNGEPKSYDDVYSGLSLQGDIKGAGGMAEHYPFANLVILFLFIYLM